ncbi:MAG: class I SAM-dependent methyltransferase [Halieaceae bacterium]
MESGRISQTAVKVASTMVTLGAKPGWQARLPQQLPELSEQLLLNAGLYPYSSRLLRIVKRPWAVRLGDLGESLQPGTFEGLGKRKIFMDQQVTAAIATGATQVLVIGAGFDTLCLRLAPQYPALHFVEIDHPATAAAKRRAVEHLGRPPNLSLIAADLGARPLSAVLGSCEGWDKREKSVAVAEGLLYYLSPGAVHELFAEFASSSGEASRVAFSYLQELEQHKLARLALRFAGEPWLSASPTEELAAYIGPDWRILEAPLVRRHHDLEGLAVAQKLAPGESAN